MTVVGFEVPQGGPGEFHPEEIPQEVPPELADVAKQVDEVFEEALGAEADELNTEGVLTAFEALAETPAPVAGDTEEIFEHGGKTYTRKGTSIGKNYQQDWPKDDG